MTLDIAIDCDSITMVKRRKAKTLLWLIPAIKAIFWDFIAENTALSSSR